MTKKVLVTGSAGFLGYHIAQFLKEKKIEVVEFDIKNGQDLLDNSTLKKTLQKVDYVCHLAAVGDVYLAKDNPVLAQMAGPAATANLSKLCDELGIKKLIYASTWEVYGKPHYQPMDENHPCFPDHPYSIAKYAGELVVRSKIAKTPWIILRLGTAYGNHMRENAVIPLFINKAKKGEKITIMGKGLQKRQFTHAKDIANAFYLAIEKEVKNEVFNIVSDEATTIKELARVIIDHYPTEIEFLPPREGDVEPAKVSSEKAQKKLSWKPMVSFKEGLSQLF